MRIAAIGLRRLGLVVLGLCLASSVPLWADDDRALVPTTRPEVRVSRIPRAPTLEEFLDMKPPPDLAEAMQPITGFIQRQPADGNPASQKTDVYLGFDDQHFYVVFVAFDEEPNKIRAHLSRREEVFADETVEIQLDTFEDQQRAFSFLTNPFGVQWDAIWTEGQGFDMAWDTVWNSHGALTDRGYVVLMEIPFKSLRFRPKPEDAEYSWGIIFVRDIPRNNETSFWPRVSSRIEGRLNQAGTATGVHGVAPGRNLWVIPYLAAGREERRTRPEDTMTPFDEANVGVDVKWVFKDNFTLDLTANPNFAQIESDEPVVTVNQRFPVFYPERRPFFLENADYFETPINLLFTRRIVDPDAGARMTGQTGKYRIGIFAINDAAPGKLAPADSDLHGENAMNGIIRVRRDLPNQSNVGFMFAGRELAGSSNGVASLDSRIKFDPNWDARLQAAFSATDLSNDETGPDEVSEFSDPSYSVVFNREGRKFNAHIHYLDIGRDFQSWLGFIPRTDIRDSHASVNYNFWPETTLIRWEPELYVEYITNQDGVRLDQTVHPGIEFELRRRTTFGVSGFTGRRRLLKCRDYVDYTCDPATPPEPGDALLPADVDFDVNEISVGFESQFFTAVDFDLQYEQGRTVNYAPVAGDSPTSADQQAVESDLTLRLGRHAKLGGRYLYTNLDDYDTGAKILTNQITRLRFDWQFNLHLSLRAILQYERTEVDDLLTRARPRDDLNADFLLTYLINPWTAFYIGVNTNETQTAFDTDGNREFRDDPYNDARLAFFKVTYLFRP